MEVMRLKVYPAGAALLKLDWMGPTRSVLELVIAYTVSWRAVASLEPFPGSSFWPLAYYK